MSIVSALSVWTGCSGQTAARQSGLAEPPTGHPEPDVVRAAPPEPGSMAPLEVAAPVVRTGRLCGQDPRIRACASHRPDGTPHLLGMAARDGTIAVAWVFGGNSWLSSSGRDAVRASRAGLALFDADLRFLRELELALAGVAWDIDVVAVPEGWVVAAQTEQSTELIWLTGQGKPSGRRVELPRAAYPGLAATAAGELLVVHIGERDGRWPVLATLVDHQGGTPWSVEVFDSSIEPNFGNQVVADNDAFLIARRTNQGVTVARVERNGAVSAQATISAYTEYPSLASCGGEGRLVWSDFSGTGTIRAAALDRAGRRRGTEHALGTIPEAFNHSPSVCDGQAWWVLRGGYTGGTGVSSRLDLMRVDVERGAEAGAIPVLASPGPNAYDARMVRLDAGRVAVAWIALEGETRSRIGLATVAAPVGAAGATLAR